MKRSILFLSFLTVVAFLAATGTAGATGQSYMYMVDSDGDGIPNCQDSDYSPPLDGTGFQHGRPVATPTAGEFTFRYTWNWRMPFLLGIFMPTIVPAAGYGPGDGTGNGGDGPGDGTGYGPGPYGTGDCDGDGPEGFVLRHGR